MIGRRLARLLFDRRPNPASAMNGGTVLLVRWDGKLGDSVVSSFVCRELRRSGRWQVQVATTAALADLHANVFNAHRVLVTSVRPGWRSLFRLWRDLDRVDVVVHLAGRLPPQELFFLWLLRPAQVYGLDDELDWVTLKLGQATRGLGISKRYAEVLRHMGLQAIDTSPALEPATPGGAYVAFNPYASRPDKSMGAAKAARTLSCLADALPRREFRILSSPETHSDALRLMQAVARDNVRTFDWMPTVHDAIAAVDGAEAVVSVDTGLVHVAVALKKRLVAIFPSLDGAHDPWLPAESATVRIVRVPQDVESYRQTGRKNMDAFDENDVRDRLLQVLQAENRCAAT